MFSLLEGRFKLLVDLLALDPPSQKVGPEEFAEGGCVLGVAADHAQFAGQATVESR